MAFGLICFFLSSLVLAPGSWPGGSSSLLVIPFLVCKGSQISDVLTCDSSLGLQRELASASAGGDFTWLWSESVGDSSSLELGRGIEMLLSILTWRLL